MNTTLMSRRRALKFTLGATLGAVAGPDPHPGPQGGEAHARHRRQREGGGIVMGEPKAAEVGSRIIKGGGNAIDAIVAAALAGAVHAPNQYGIGGYGGHMIVRLANGTVTCIDFNTAAPRGGQVATYGWRAAGVPGILAGLQRALDRFGTRSFQTLVEPAIDLAENGFTMSQGLANAIRSREKELKNDPASARIYFPKDKTLRNPDLARMLRRLASQNSVGDFYDGEIAGKIAAAFANNGGSVTETDLKEYNALEVRPMSVEWHSFRIYTPPLTAGGATVLRMFEIVKHLSPEISEHAVLETMRVAWHERLAKFGDGVSLETLVPAEVLAGKVKAAVKEGKRVAQTTISKPHRGTVHLNAADALGNVVALTLTHGNAFGACVTVPGLGLTLGHGMSRFDAEPGHPNAPAAGKRPLTNMCPTLVLQNDKPLLAVGAAGGRLIVNTVFHVLWNFVGGKSAQEAIRAPRWHTEGDGEVAMERAWSESVRDRFCELGYQVRPGGAAVARAIAPDERGHWEAFAR